MDASTLHKDALIWDAHRDVAYEAPREERFLQGWVTGVDMHLPLMRAGGIDAQVYAICVAGHSDLQPTAQAIKELDSVMNTVDAHADAVVLATTTGEVLAAKRQGKLAVVLGMEGAEPILTELGLLRMFYRMGLRHMGLTWSHRNALANGRNEGRVAGGLSKFGVSVVEEMNRLGMVVDVAHLALKGIEDVVRVSQAPIIYSHGATRLLAPDHVRTVDDYLLEGIASTGGAFCVTTIPGALSLDPANATIDHFLDHIDHGVRVAGIDHIGLGADFDVYQSHLGLPRERWLGGLEEADQWPNVTAGLLGRGYSETDVRKIMGENLLRIFRTVIG